MDGAAELDAGSQPATGHARARRHWQLAEGGGWAAGARAGALRSWLATQAARAFALWRVQCRELSSADAAVYAPGRGIGRKPMRVAGGVLSGTIRIQRQPDGCARGLRPPNRPAGAWLARSPCTGSYSAGV